MSATVAIVVEGVLQSLVGDAVIPQGARLYHGLKETYKVALLTNETETDKVEYWLRINGFTDHPYLLPIKDTDPDGIPARRVRQVGRLRAVGNNVDLVVEPDPEVAAELISNGLAVLNLIHPKYARPQFRPDYDGAITPWSALAAEVERQEALRAQDARPVMETL